MSTTQTSLYKVLDSIDLSRNNIINVSKILGDQYDDLAKDLEITTWDNEESNNPAGNLLIRAGVNNTVANSGKIYIFSGATTREDERGLTVNPDSSIKLYAVDTTTGDIEIIANHQLLFKALKNKVTFNQVIRDGVVYNVAELKNIDESGIGEKGEIIGVTDKAAINITDALNVTAGSSDAYKLTVSSGSSSEEVHNLHIKSSADIDGVFDYDGTSFTVDADSEIINAKDLTIKAGGSSPSTEAALTLSATLIGGIYTSKLNIDEITVDNKISTDNLEAKTAIIQTKLTSNTELEAQKKATLTGTVAVNNESGVGTFTVNSKTVKIDNNSSNGSVQISSPIVDVDTPSYSLKSNNITVLSTGGQENFLKVDRVTVDDTLDLLGGKLNLGTSSTSSTIIAENKLSETLKEYELKAGEAINDYTLKVTANSSKSTIRATEITANDLATNNLVAETIRATTQLRSDTEFFAQGSSTLQDIIAINNGEGEGSFSVNSKTVSLNNSSISDASTTLNTKALDIDATIKTEDISGNSTTTVVGTLKEEAATLELKANTSFKLTANSNDLIVANSSSSTITVDNVIANKKIDITEGALNLGDVSHNGTIRGEKKISIETPELTIIAGGENILTASPSSSTLNVDAVKANSVEAANMYATSDITIGNKNTGLMIYWDNLSNSVVFVKKG